MNQEICISKINSIKKKRMNEEEKREAHQYQQLHYGTFSNYYSPPPPPVGFPQPVPPPSSSGGSSQPPPLHPYPAPAYYAHAYQAAIPAYPAIAEGRPLVLRMQRLPCCGMGIGWFLFIIGFFFAAIPWYVGAFILLCVRIDYREKPGFIACTIAAILAAIAVLVGATKEVDVW